MILSSVGTCSEFAAGHIAPTAVVLTIVSLSVRAIVSYTFMAQSDCPSLACESPTSPRRRSSGVLASRAMSSHCLDVLGLVNALSAGFREQAGAAKAIRIRAATVRKRGALRSCQRRHIVCKELLVRHPGDIDDRVPAEALTEFLEPLG